ncbi:hypothetical protein M9435_003759 [Picochlorum sp. BPE23]|nr:hypothetical protein M9435_003759 [Picochlorum sp. BPE23]
MGKKKLSGASGASGETHASAEELEARGWKRAGSVTFSRPTVGVGYKSIRDLMGEEYIDYLDLSIKNKLGEGAFANVFLAKLIDGTEVAVKMLKHEHLKDEEEIFLFLKEIKTLKKLHHRNIVQLIGMGGVQDGKGKVIELFVVTEVLKGGTLRRLVQDQMITVHHKQYSIYEATQWCLGVAKALQYLHKATPKVIHRDLKLENVILTVSPRTRKKGEEIVAKLADFGLATLLEKHTKDLYSDIVDEVMKKPEAMWSSLTRTRSNKVVALLEKMQSMSSYGSPSNDESMYSGFAEATGVAGSYGYMAPEVFLNQTYTEKVDIFSFGVLMYNLCYRVIPSLMIMSNGDTQDMVVYAKQVADGFRQPLSDEKIPKQLNEIIESCWSHDPADRPSATKVVDMLTAVLESEVLDPDEAVGGCCCIVS